MLFACGETTENTTMDDADMDDVETTMPETEPMASQPSPQLQNTVQAVQGAGGDITALDPGAAVGNIDGWINELRGMDGADGIVNDLESLKGELQGGNIDGGRVSNLLSSLADQTRGMSDRAPGLSSLASALQAGADKLAGK